MGEIPSISISKKPITMAAHCTPKYDTLTNSIMEQIPPLVQKHSLIVEPMQAKKRRSPLSNATVVNVFREQKTDMEDDT